MLKWVPFLISMLVYTALLAFLSGLHLASSYQPEAQWGHLEFFVERYQTLIAAGTALLAAWFAWLQIHEQRDIQTRLMMLQYRREMDALYVAMEMAIYVRQEIDKGAVPRRFDQGIINSVTLHASPKVARSMELTALGAARVNEDNSFEYRVALRDASVLLEKQAHHEYRDIGDLISSVLPPPKDAVIS